MASSRPLSPSIHAVFIGYIAREDEGHLFERAYEISKGTVWIAKARRFYLNIDPAEATIRYVVREMNARAASETD